MTLQEQIAERRAKLTASLVHLVASKQTGPHLAAIEEALAALSAQDADALGRWLDGTRFLIATENPTTDHPWRRKAFRAARKPRRAPPD